MYWRFNDDGTPFERGHLLLRDVYFKPHAYLDDGLAPIFRGLVVQVRGTCLGCGAADPHTALSRRRTSASPWWTMRATS